MPTDIINIGLAFLEGFALIISPCILPILPIILAGSLDGSKKRPLGIIVGFILAFSLFTFFSRKIVQISGLDLSIVRDVSYILLVLFGVVMLSTYLTEKFARLTQRLANTGPHVSNGDDFFSGVIFGGLVGLIWTPCAGPILAAVIVQTVLQKTTLGGFLVVLAFGIGAAIPMLFIMLFGRNIMTKFSFFRNHAMLLRKLLGVIIIASVAYMIYGGGVSTSLAQSDVRQNSLIDGLIEPYQSPQITGISTWINSPPIDLAQLKGKVVLIDFWTYSCINCLRTLPYIKDWYQKYHDKGFEIIGVHTPEFDFEKDPTNVKNAVKKLGIDYPVALDNQFGTWQNFNNRYWPAHYLIDKNGLVVYQHFGEGDYDVTENNIRFLLGLNKSAVKPAASESIPFSQTPETYLGYARAENYASPQAVIKGRPAIYTFPVSLDENQWALQGNWIIGPEYIVAQQSDAMLKIHFNAGKVFIVMGTVNNKPIKVKIVLNGEKVISSKGSDVVDSVITVKDHRLYEVLVLKNSGDGLLQITSASPGLQIYTLTFGGE